MEYQDKMTDLVVEAKKLQTKSGWTIGLAMGGKTDLIPVDMIINSLISMTTRKDLKEKLTNATKATN